MRPLPYLHAEGSRDEDRWLSCFAAMGTAGIDAARPLYGRPEARVVLGRGAGGDNTLAIDRACEDAIHAALTANAPFPHQLISEESGISGPSEADWRVVVDPLDGSLNAKRGLEPFGVSLAAADGPSLGNARVGYVRDFLRPHTFSAIKGSGLLEAGEPDETLDPRRFKSDLVEIVLLEAAPDRHRFHYHDLDELGGLPRTHNMRVRQVGSLALSLCYVAVGIADVLVAAVRSRSVDLAAGLLILSEAGGAATTLFGEDVLTQPLDLEKRSPFIAWRSGLNAAEMLRRVRRLAEALVDS